MINGKTILKRDVFDKPRGNKISSLEANQIITASENIFQWLHLSDGGWVSAGPEQQYIKWEVVLNSEDPATVPSIPDPIIHPTPEIKPQSNIIGKTLTKRDIFDKPKGDKNIGSLGANIEIVATENIFQWLHLGNGGWVSAGHQQRYIKWEVVTSPTETSVPDGSEPDTHLPPATEFRKVIQGKTILKRDITREPRGEVVIGSIDANVEIIASENKFQWLHLEGGGWVNAGKNQEYIKWNVVNIPIIPSPLPAPIVTPSPPEEPWPITTIKRKGRIATLLVDWQNPKWEYAPRQVVLDRYFLHPQTVTFNTICAKGKGISIPLTDEMKDYVGFLNGEKIQEIILRVGSGWINIPTAPGTVERLSWAANHVIVKETKVEQDVEYSNIHAIDCYETNLTGTFFDKDMRLVLHKYNAITRDSKILKLSTERDCYTPLITDPNLNHGEMWIPSEYLEFWPELPFTLSDDTQIIEYELFGYSIYGLQADGKSILLRDPDGFKTNWKINSPEVPI